MTSKLQYTCPAWVLIVLGIACLSLAAEGATWTCIRNATAVPVDVDQVAGSWYEIARAPRSDVPACLEVVAPAAAEDDEYTLRLNYVNNESNQWKRVQENLTFPWDNATMSGLFVLTYGYGTTKVHLNFKFMGTLRGYSVVCGYTDLFPGLSIIRVLSRNRTVNGTYLHLLEDLLTTSGIDTSQVTWVEQGARCNSASSLLNSTFGLMLLLSLGHWIRGIAAHTSH